MAESGQEDHRRAPVKITDVAALAGVSIGTASKALNNTGQLRAATREKVQAAAEALGFVLDQRGRSLSSGRSYTVGLLTTDSFGRFSIPIMIGAEDVLSAGQFAVLMCDTRDDPLREVHYVRSLIARRVDGIIVTGRSADPRRPISAPMPVLYAFTPSTDPHDESIVVDDAGGSEMAVRHLCDIGRQKIAHVTGPAHHGSATRRATAAERSAGSRLAMPPLYGEWSERWGRRATDLVLRAHTDIDAISCGSDQIARGVCDRLRDAGKRVPDDVAVTGYDNWDVMALASRPPLTSVDMGLEELGRAVGTRLLEMIERNSDAHRPEAVVPRLVIRESTVAG